MSCSAAALQRPDLPAPAIVPRTPRVLLALASLALAITPALTAQSLRAGAIIGEWAGTSICVKAAWNAACHDEVTEYHFVPESPDSARAVIHAFKLVQGQLDSMGALPLVFISSAQRWDATFTSRRGDATWRFWLHGDTLLGALVLGPDSQVARHVAARRRPPERAPHD